MPKGLLCTEIYLESFLEISKILKCVNKSDSGIPSLMSIFNLIWFEAKEIHQLEYICSEFYDYCPSSIV